MVEKFVVCEISKKKVKFSEATPIEIVRPGIVDLIKKQRPLMNPKGYVSKNALRTFREKYIQQMLAAEQGELSKLDKDVVKSMVHHETISKNVNKQFEKRATIGPRVADKVAEFGGSWNFLGIFAFVLVAWVIVNTIIIVRSPPDPYPFLLLNIILSCLAAIQAPVIMMSQNRKEEKDRIRGENDYKVNLKAELEIRILHEKIDNLIQHQWKRLMEIQQLQIDLMEEREKSLSKRNSSIRKNK